MREIIQLDIIKQILTEYTDDLPLHFFLKYFYKKHRQFGSRDRRFYTDTIYKYFRCKTLFYKLPIEEKLCYSGFLTSSYPIDFYRYLLKQQNISLSLIETWDKPIVEKLNSLKEAGKICIENYFPAFSSVEGNIRNDDFLFSHLIQPEFFIRVRKNYTEEIRLKLNEQEIAFKQNGEAFAFTSKLDISKFIPDEMYEVQDISSQETIGLFDLKGKEKLWDCCAGAGGKSLMLKDHYPEIELYCSDKRESILKNLKERFQKVNIQPYGVAVFDVIKNTGGLAFNKEKIPDGFFDIILADAPCTGSGTWGRNPERLYQFKEPEIEVYVNLQKSIVANSLRYLKPGGLLIYITCSVYTAENTSNLKTFEAHGLKMQLEKYFIGHTRNADTLYGAVMEKIS